MNQQLKLDLIYTPYTPYLFRKAKRVISSVAETSRWMQLELKLYLRKLVKGGIAFTFTMPNGREFRVPTLAEIGRRICKPVRIFLGING